MVDSLGSAVQEYKNFRTVTVPESASLTPNNLTTADGKTFATIKNTSKGGQVLLWKEDLVDNTEDSIYPTITLNAHSSDCISAKFLKVGDKILLVICHMDLVLIYN